eukprot:1496142-Alexandrium_andersonii.AAC.1
MSASLVGSEMCIRDRRYTSAQIATAVEGASRRTRLPLLGLECVGRRLTVSYTHLTLPTICSV